ncbi:DNA repair protein RadA [Flavobacteriales bacterium]|nr:DNA repair protein RadA [Flavobacteriales bacterium]|tara:strand:- start:910 stop:2256 length:1347 start_codon:yes stop_codon:yes gene_type:complete
MVKSKKIFQCINCDNESSKWTGKCVNCGEWNTVSERTVAKSSKNYISNSIKTPQLIGEISGSKAERIHINDQEFNRVIGNGLVKGSVILLGGEPGIGKSTLTLKIALTLNEKVLYISGEESNEQIKLRATRIDLNNEKCYIYNETEVNTILKTSDEVKPELIIIDSIQTIHTQDIDAIPGSVSQIKHCAEQLIKYAKDRLIPIIIIGHITKDGAIAGPKVLEHMVDTVLQFEGDKNHLYRLVRSIKNRFGSTNELGIYEMNENGLQEVNSPSKMLISTNQEKLSGIALGCSLEGIRPIMIESQALTSAATYGNPQRSANGIDIKRLNMLLAVIEKRGGMKLSQKDVFLNITGGLKIQDPAIDLSMVCAILSSFFDFYIDHKICFIGEVGLSGEIRPVSRIEQRIKEVTKMGIKTIYLSKYSKINDLKIQDYTLKKVGKLQEIIQHLFK